MKLALILAALAACGSPGPYYCCTDDDCASSKLGSGQCQSDYGFCAYPDDRCNSGYRYHDSAAELAGVCVGDEPFAPRR